MLAGVLDSVLKKYLAFIFEDLKLEDFSFTGRLVLKDVRIKANAFDALKLPFRIVHGFVGEMNATIPWLISIYTEPVVVKIRDVYVVAVPNKEIPYDEKEAKEEEWQLKKSYLENIELMKQKLEQESTTTSQDDGFIMNLVASIIKNIQISIENVHICYEDNSTSINNIFQIGVTLTKLLFETQPKKDGTTLEHIIDKIVKLEGFSIYMNFNKLEKLHGKSVNGINGRLKELLYDKSSDLNYVLCPINFITNAKINRKPEAYQYKHAIADINMSLEAFQLQLNNNQIEVLMLLMDAIDRMQTAAPYRRWRPNVSIQGNSKKWWQFLYLAVVENGTRRRKRDFSWKYIESNCLKRKQYTDLYKKKLLGERVDGLEQLEKELNLIVIVMARGQAELATKRIQQANSKKGWLGGWWGSSGKTEDSVLDDIKKEMTPEEKDKIFKAIGYDEKTLVQLYPLDFVAHKAKFKIKHFKVSIARESTNLAAVQIYSCNFEFAHRPSSGNILVRNEVDSLVCTGTKGNFLMKSMVEKNFMEFVFELNPLDHLCDFCILLNMKSLHFMYDIETVKQLYRVFKPAENISLDEIQSYAQNKLGDIKLMTYTHVKFAVERHKQLKLNIEIEPSYVIVPKDGDITKLETAQALSDTSIILLSLGKFVLNSTPVSKNNVTRVTSELSHDPEEMKKIVYEKYTLRIMHVQIVLSDKHHWQQDTEKLQTDRHILYPLELTLDIKRSIVPDNVRFPKITLDGEIPLIQVKASDLQIKRLMNLFLTLPLDPTDLDGAKSIKPSIDQTDQALKSAQKLPKPMLSDEMSDAKKYATKTVEKIEKIKVKEKEVSENKSTDQLDAATVVAYTETDINFRLREISLILYRGGREPNCTFTKLNLIQFYLDLRTFTNSTLVIDLKVVDLRVDDLRPNRKEDGIRTMLSKLNRSEKDKKEILSVILNQKSKESFVHVTMSRFILILSLDYLMALAEVATSAFTPEVPPANLRKSSVSTLDASARSQTTMSPAQSSAVSSTNTSPSMIQIFNFCLNKMEVIMIESLDVPDSEACVFNCSAAIDVRMQDDVIMVGGKIEKIRMGLSNYLRYVESRKHEAYIMSPTDLFVNGSIRGKKMNLDISFSDILVTVSPEMVTIMVNIFGALGGSADTPVVEKAEEVEVGALMRPAPFDEKTSKYCPKTEQAEEADEHFGMIVIDEENVLMFNLKSITLVIKSGGPSDEPLIRTKISFVANLKGNNKFHFDCQMVADYYNLSALCWEPLMESVDQKRFALAGDIFLPVPSSSKDDKNSGEEKKSPMKINIDMERLELLLTKSSINVFYTISSVFSQAFMPSRGLKVFETNRVIIRNFLGIKINILVPKSDVIPLDPEWQAKFNASKDKNEMMYYTIDSDAEYFFSTSNIISVELNANLCFSDAVVINRLFVCRESSIRCFFTPIKTYPVNEEWKFIVQVFDSGSNTKEITFRSNTQVVNKFDCDFDLFMAETIPRKISAHSSYYLPLDLVYTEDSMFLRPALADYDQTHKPLAWRHLEVKQDSDPLKVFSSVDMSPKKPAKSMDLRCVDKTNPKKVFQLKVLAEKHNVFYEDTEQLNNEQSYIYSVLLVPLVKFKNLLPYSIELTYEALNEAKNLISGQEFILPLAHFGRSILTIRILNYLGQDWETQETLPTPCHNDTHYLIFKSLSTHEKLTLSLGFVVENNSQQLMLYAPYWFVNRTNESLIYKIDEFHSYRHLPNKELLFLLSFDPNKVIRKNKLCISVNDSEFSNYLSLNVVPFNGTLLPKAKSSSYSYPVSVQIELSRIGLSRIITFNSFYSVINLSKQLIEYSENNEDWYQIDKESLKPFFPTRNKDQSLCFRFSGSVNSSRHISLRESSPNLLEIEDRYIYVDVDVNELEVKVKISDYFEGAAPVLIVNNLPYTLYFGQKNVTNFERNKHVHQLPRNHQVYFCWIDPLAPREVYFKHEKEFEFTSISVDYDKSGTVDTTEESYFWVTFLDGKQRVLLFTKKGATLAHVLKTDEYTKPTMVIELVSRGIGLNIVDNEKHLDLFYFTIDSSCVWEFSDKSKNKGFRALSIKDNGVLETMYQNYLLKKKNPSAEEIRGKVYRSYNVDFDQMVWKRNDQAQWYLRRSPDRGLFVCFSQSETIKQIFVKINRIQIDNQLPDHTFDVVFSPMVVNKSVVDKLPDIMMHDFIELTVIIHSQQAMQRFKAINLLIQEFMIRVEWGWISMLMNVFDLEASKEDSSTVAIKKDIEYLVKNNTVDELKNYSQSKTYFDSVTLSPIKMHMSVAVGDLPDGKFPFGLDFIVRFTGITVGEINDTLFKLDCFERKHAFLANSEITGEIIHHYQTQALLQFYKLILGLDIIGNPMKLALGIKKGIGDFFYEPALGIVQGPEEFAEGLATGVKSLASNVIGGTAGALGRIGNRLGSGVATLTIDEKFQKERRERLNRKGGFAESGKNLFRGFVSGVTGLVTKPIEGAREDGVGGLFKGVGRGVVGVVAQPATGVIDFASGSLHAVDNLMDQKVVIKPVRPPRPMTLSKEITPYVSNVARGNQILMQLSEGKYAHTDSYKYHLELDKDQIVLLSNQRLFKLKYSSFSSQWDEEWIELWSNLEEVYQETNGVRVTLKVPHKNFFGFGAVKERTIMCNSNSHVQNLYTQIRRHINTELSPKDPSRLRNRSRKKV